jgi:signal transduction histidine kinase
MTSSAAGPRPRFRRWRGEFADRATEREFRAAYYTQTRAQNRTVGILLASFYVLYVASDYWLLGASAKFFELLALRLGYAALSLWFLVPYRPASDHAASEARTFALQAAMPFVYFYIASQMPAAHIHGRLSLPSVFAVIIVLAQYAFFANRLIYSATAALITTAVYVAMTLAVGRLPVGTLMLELGAHAIVHVGGYFVGLRAATMARRQFALFAEQARLNRALVEGRRDLEAARDRALHATRAKSEFLAHMSHELRTPLNAIAGFAEVMRREMFGPLGQPRYRDYASDIQASAAHLGAVIDDVLDLSRAEAGKMTPQIGPVDLAGAIEAVRRLVSLRAEGAGVALATPDGKLPPLVADARMVKQMLLNLVTNALKFTPRDGHVTISATADAAGAVRLAVTDDGEGLDDEEIPRVLEPYGRSDVARAAQKEGTGLGLPLVKAMIEAHGGRVTIESKKGRGSTFALHFPAPRAA